MVMCKALWWRGGGTFCCAGGNIVPRVLLYLSDDAWVHDYVRLPFCRRWKNFSSRIVGFMMHYLLYPMHWTTDVNWHTSSLQDLGLSEHRTWKFREDNMQAELSTPTRYRVLEYNQRIKVSKYYFRTISEQLSRYQIRNFWSSRNPVHRNEIKAISRLLWLSLLFDHAGAVSCSEGVVNFY
jgi:hypothetical protein